MNIIPIKIKIEIFNAPPNVQSLMLGGNSFEIENLVTKTKSTSF